MDCVRQCANCGKEFNPRGPQKNCSKECMINYSKDYKSKWHNKNRERGLKERRANYYKKFTPIVKVCSICGSDFNMRDRRGLAVTCSKECGELFSLPKQIRFEVKRQLGTEPPAVLVEEATALRLLNRALREIT